MTTLRVRLAAPVVPDRVDAWGLFDADGAFVRAGTGPPDAWPPADKVEAVLAASQLRIASLKLPPMPPSRVAGAAGFALEDQLAGPDAAHHLVVSAQGPDGRVRVTVIAHALLAGIVGARDDITRVIAEPELAAPTAGWRWCAGEGAGGFIRCTDGSAFPVDVPAREGTLPPELVLALAQAGREGRAPPHVRVDATCADAALSHWQRETGIAFLRGTPWRWQTAPADAFASAPDLLASVPTSASATPHRRIGHVFAPAILFAGVALTIHIIASLGEWTSLRLDTWRDAREWTSLAVAAGVAPDAATTPQSARAALGRRYADLRHANGLPAPDDALPLLARAAPALAVLPPGTVKSGAYADGHWTLDLVNAAPALVSDLDAQMRVARVPALVATTSTGTRVRFGGP